ncbi:MAG: hypothetical protein U5K56_04955 [Halioglobus sp.]|nr:hypothetical protein [Halioglobus sp.]
MSKYYGPLKVRCEQQAEKALPGRVTRLRCGHIIGPGDRTDQFTYWPERVAHGDEVLAPGTGEAPVQTIDVRDLADWVVHCIENRLVGSYRHHQPRGPVQHARCPRPVPATLESRCRTDVRCPPTFWRGRALRP